MWIVRDRFIGELENPLESLETARTLARTYSGRGYPLVEVVDADKQEIVRIFVDGREFVENKSIQSNDVRERREETVDREGLLLDPTAVQAHGRRIWEQLSARHSLVMRLGRKLEGLSTGEKQLLHEISRVIRAMELQLQSVLSENEFTCCYFKFVQSANPGWFVPTTPSYCDRQIRRYVAQALKKTGHAAVREQWNFDAALHQAMSTAV